MVIAFSFFSNEGDEPRHMHVEKGDGVAKRIISNHQEYLINKWDEYFND